MSENDGAKLPQDPMTALAEGANQMHEVFISYVKAGFSESQALYLVGQMLRAAIVGGPGSD